jgi:ABC-type oligopeptide transport system ATPase subunit
MEGMVEVQELVKSFDSSSWWSRRRGRSSGVAAVRGVSLGVAKGEIFGLVGESGSGKTTLGRCILGLETPTSGSIRFEGKAIPSLKPKEMRALRPYLQAVFQDPKSSLNPRMTVAQILDESLRLLTEADGEARSERTQEILAEVGLGSAVLGRYRHQLSGGQQQRVSIARALVVNPSFIVLDEPVTALDASVRWQVLELLANLQSKHELTYLYISHDLDTVQRLCRRVAVMFRGTVVELGPTSRIFDNPLHPYTKLLLGSVLDLTPAERRGQVAGSLIETDTLPMEIVQPELAEMEAGHFVASSHMVDADRAVRARIGAQER